MAILPFVCLVLLFSQSYLQTVCASGEPSSSKGPILRSRVPVGKPKGTRSSAETRQKISEALKSRPKTAQHRENLKIPRSEETKRKISATLTGRPKSAEHIANMVASARKHRWENNLGIYALRGKEKTVEQKERLSQIAKTNNVVRYLGDHAMKGFKKPREQVEKQRATKQGKILTQDHKDKIGAGGKRAWQRRKEALLHDPIDEQGEPKRIRVGSSAETRKKQSIGLSGRTLSKEHKRNLSIARNKYFERKRATTGNSQRQSQQNNRPALDLNKTPRDFDLNKPPPDDDD